MNLDNCYEQTVAELGLQQSKRDQIIAFYLTILGIVIPNVVGLKVSDPAKGMAFIAMYGIGVIFSHVILRYRIYKEVYWIACRVISQMCNILPERRTKENIYILFYNALVHNRSSIVQYSRSKGEKKVSLFYSFKRQLNSAETLLYETLALVSVFVGGIGGYYLWNVRWWIGAAAWIIVVYMFVVVNVKYCKRLVALYRCIEEEENEIKVEYLEKTFEKAWMLHCYLDDVMEDEDSSGFDKSFS